LDSSAIISAGGSGKRRNELQKDFNLNPNQMVAYTNRFADVTRAAAYRLDNFENVAKWHTEGKTLNLHDSDDDDIEEALHTRLSRSKTAYSTPKKAVISLGIHVELLGTIPQLVKDVSAEFDNVPSNVVDKLKLLRSSLQVTTSNLGATRCIRQICARYCPDMAEGSISTCVNDFCVQVKAAATKGLISYDKHITPNLANYILRMRYTIQNSPDGSDNAMDEGYNSSFFGCEPRNFGNEIIINWIEYRVDWQRRSKENALWFKNTTNYEYWSSVKTKWPLLVDEALWWINWPMSSIACERGFALARIIDSPRRGKMDWETFANELKLKCNEIVLDSLLDECIKTVAKFLGR
jgi:hypothetical protein